MKWIVTLLFGVLALSFTASVSGQTVNYLMMSLDAAMELQAQYDGESDYFSELLTEEATEMGDYYTELLADAVELATTAAQGERIQSCADIIHYLSWSNINYMANYLLANGRASDRLHKTVWNQLRTMNIKEYDPELFYYYHGYVIEEAYEELWDNYSYNLLNAWVNIYLEFMVNYNELYYCVQNALSN